MKGYQKLGGVPFIRSPIHPLYLDAATITIPNTGKIVKVERVDKDGVVEEREETTTYQRYVNRLPRQFQKNYSLTYWDLTQIAIGYKIEKTRPHNFGDNYPYLAMHTEYLRRGKPQCVHCPCHLLIGDAKTEACAGCPERVYPFSFEGLEVPIVNCWNCPSDDFNPNCDICRKVKSRRIVITSDNRSLNGSIRISGPDTEWLLEKITYKLIKWNIPFHLSRVDLRMRSPIPLILWPGSRLPQFYVPYIKNGKYQTCALGARKGNTYSRTYVHCLQHKEDKGDPFQEVKPFACEVELKHKSVEKLKYSPEHQSPCLNFDLAGLLHKKNRNQSEIVETAEQIGDCRIIKVQGVIMSNRRPKTVISGYLFLRLPTACIVWESTRFRAFENWVSSWQVEKEYTARDVRNIVSVDNRLNVYGDDVVCRERRKLKDSWDKVQDLL